MLIRIRDATEISASEITAPGVYRQRRRFLRDATALATLGLVPGLLLGTAEARDRAPAGDSGAGSAPAKFTNVRKSAYSANEKPASYADVTTYNNFYEFGTDKSDPARHAGSLKPRPWSVAIEGEVRKPAVYTLEDLLKGHVLEERIYRLRCVEAWSMVIPWVGIPLGDVIKRLGPTGKAKFVEFTTLHDPVQMPGQRPGLFGAGIDWPYVEGLRMDEAIHPLTILAVGLYGEVLPNQNGAPLRLVVPWKYGFKSIKSIVKMRFVEKPTQTTWMKAAPREYGFYANVNPQVDHPRWSQASERRIGEGSSLFSPRRKTLMFNGYAEQVAHLYAGMDLRRYY